MLPKKQTPIKETAKVQQIVEPAKNRKSTSPQVPLPPPSGSLEVILQPVQPVPSPGFSGTKTGTGTRTRTGIGKGDKNGDGHGGGDEEDGLSKYNLSSLRTPPDKKKYFPLHEKQPIDDGSSQISEQSRIGSRSSSPKLFYFAQSIHEPEPEPDDECCCHRSRRFCMILGIICGAILMFVVIPICTTLIVYEEGGLDSQEDSGPNYVETTKLPIPIPTFKPIPTIPRTTTNTTQASSSETTTVSSKARCLCNTDALYIDERGQQHKNGDPKCGNDKDEAKTCSSPQSLCYVRSYKSKLLPINPKLERSCIPPIPTTCNSGECRIVHAGLPNEYAECYCGGDLCNDMGDCQCSPESNSDSAGIDDNLKKSKCYSMLNVKS